MLTRPTHAGEQTTTIATASRLRKRKSKNVKIQKARIIIALPRSVFHRTVRRSVLCFFDARYHQGHESRFFAATL
jgi:hypothetical protein